MKAFWLCSPLVILGSLTPSVAQAVPSMAARYVVFVEAEAEDAPSPATLIEATLGTYIQSQGGTVIDDAQSRKIRSQTRARDLISGRAAEVITSLDADVVVSAHFQCSSAPVTESLKDQTFRFLCSGILKSFAVDSAEILGQLTAERSGYGFTKAQAVREAARRVTEVLQEGVGPVPHAGRRIELTVHGVSDVARMQVVRQNIEQLSGVQAVNVEDVALPDAEFTIQVGRSGPTPEALALAIDALGGMTVVGYSKRAVQIELREDMSTSAAIATGSTLQIETDFTELFPSRIEGYKRSGLGDLRLTNTTDLPLKDIEVTVLLQGYASGPVTWTIPTLEPKATRVQALTLPLDERALKKRVGDDTAAMAITWTVGRDKVITGRVDRSIRVLDRRAIDWRVPESAGAFIVPSNRIRALAERIQQVLGPDRTEPVTIAAGIVTALQKLQYAVDPRHPGRSDLDQIRWPDETLSSGLGDCDDGTILVAAVAQAAGIETALVLLPGHVLVALDTGRPAQGWHEVAGTPEEVVIVGQKAFLPIETTALHKGFMNAWTEGARRIRTAQRQGASVDIVSVAEAWKMYPPVDLAEPNETASRAITPNWDRKVRGAIHEWRDHYQRAWDVHLRKASADTPLGILARVKAGQNEAVISQLSRQPDSPKVSTQLGNLYLMTDRPKEALKQYQVALQSGAGLPTRLNALLAAYLLKDMGTMRDLMTSTYQSPEDHRRAQALVTTLSGASTKATKGSNADTPSVTRLIFWEEN